MKIHDGYRAYGISQTQEDALVARNTGDPELMLQIAKNSPKRLVLLNLVRNPRLQENADVVEALYDRDLSYVNKSLSSLGYEKKNFLSRLF